MGLAFPDKIMTLLELHRGNSWLSNQQLFEQLHANHRDGFFYTDEDGRAKCVSESAINNALNDARYWMILNLEADRSKLSDYGLRTKEKGKPLPRLIRAVLADVLELKTREWAGQNKAMDVNSFTNEIRMLPVDTIPTTHQIWLLLSEKHPDIFSSGRLTERRLGQLLGLLGPRGAQIFAQPRVQLHLFEDDPRCETIRMSKGGD
jgi:hypothetical protein